MLTGEQLARLQQLWEDNETHDRHTAARAEKRLTITPQTGRKPLSLPGSGAIRLTSTPNQKNNISPIANRLNTRFIVYLPQIELIADLACLFVLE